MDPKSMHPTRSPRQYAPAAAKAVPYWFMSNPFRAGDVYRQLEKSSFEYIVGLDIGHGESLAALYSKSTGKVELLKLNRNHDTKIPSYIYFDIQPSREQALIGRAAGNHPGFIQHFKVDPSHWDETLKGITHRNLMGNFIRTLWQQILALSDTLRNAPKDKILLVVGCPASGLWTSDAALDQYKQLVRKATGCRFVSILPESTAAIMSVIHSADGLSAGQQLRLDRGVGVLDAGSSTLDFTYVVLGKKLICRSEPLGGGGLDRQILAVVLEQNGIREDQIPAEQLDDILVELRQAKERFYPDHPAPKKVILPIWGRNPDGTANPELDSGLALTYTMGQALMTAALNRPAFEPRGTIGGRKKSWLEMAADFISQTHDLIVGKDTSGQLCCDMVLVTGGTSHVTELMDLIRSTYQGTRVVRSQDPSSSVAKGLAHAKRLDISGHDRVEAYHQSVRQIVGDAYGEFLWEVCVYMADVACDISRDEFLRLSQPTSTNALKRALESCPACDILTAVQNKAQSDPRLVGKERDQKIQELFRKHMEAAYDKLREEANGVSADIYGATLASSLPRIASLSRTDLAALSAKLNVSGMVGTAMNNNSVFEILILIVQQILLIVAVLALESGNIPIAAILGVVYIFSEIGPVQKQVKEFIARQRFPISKRDLAKFSRKLDTDKERKKIIDKSCSSMLEDIVKKLKQQQKAGGITRDPRPFFPEFTACLEEQAEAILGKLLFLVYDEEPDSGSEDAL